MMIQIDFGPRVVSSIGTVKIMVTNLTFTNLKLW